MDEDGNFRLAVNPGTSKKFRQPKTISLLWKKCTFLKKICTFQGLDYNLSNLFY